MELIDIANEGARFLENRKVFGSTPHITTTTQPPLPINTQRPKRQSFDEPIVVQFAEQACFSL